MIFFAMAVIISPITFKGNANYLKADEINNLDIPNDSRVIWDSDQTISGTVTIEPRATLIIKDGATINFGSFSHIIVNGRLFVNGTLDKPIYFKRVDPNFGYSIWINDGGKAVVKNADISGPGMQLAQVGSNIPFINTAYAGTYQGGFSVRGGELEIQGSKIHNGLYGVGIEITADPKKVIVQRSSFINNQTDVYNDSLTPEYDNEYADFRFNWWGSAIGPSQECYTYNSVQTCNYDKVFGNINLKPFRAKEEFHDPVIIVPGILCSWKITDGGDWQLDPIFKTYDSLYDTFENNGYSEGIDLFTLPYQWRASNTETAKLLRGKIQEIKTTTNWPKVDVVAHSMGGLVARQYIESDDPVYGYKGDIDQLITLGTPNSGSPEDYLIWESGDVSNGKFDIVGLLLNKIFKQEAKENNYESVFSYLHKKPIKSVEELLSTYNYLYDVSSNKMRSYADNEHYPKNVFLDTLNLPENVEKLNKVSSINIVGKLGDNTTINEIRVGEPSIDEDSIWAHGEPIKDGYAKSDGDGTVPFGSAESIPYDEQIEIDSSHMKLPGDARSVVYKTLTGVFPENKTPFVWTDKRLFFFALSPIDIQIIAPDGIHWAGKKIDDTLLDINKIGGAFYTGSDTDNEFVTIPDPENGEYPKDGGYKIITQGTDNGAYTVEVSKISEDENNPGQVTESTVDIRGMTVEDRIEESVATVSGTNVSTEESGSTDTTPPSITASVSPEPNEDGWNNADVTIHFEATDESGIKSVTPDVTLNNEGQDQSATGTAEDNADNASSKTVSGINIDKTAPTTVAEPIGTQGNNGWYTSSVTINFSATDGLSGAEKTSYSLDDGSVQNGNSLTISGDGQYRIKYHSRDRAGNEEEENAISIKIDQTAPDIQIVSPANGNYENNATPEVKYAVTDGLSGVDERRIVATLDEKNYTKNRIDLSLEVLGKHTLRVDATDAAGNYTQSQTDFTVTTSIEAIKQNIKHYFSLGFIKKMSTEFFLEVKLRNIQEMTRLLDTLRSKWMPQWAKDRVIQSLKQNINRQIDDLERQIQYNKNFKRTINSKIQAILMEDLEAVRVY